MLLSCILMAATPAFPVAPPVFPAVLQDPPAPARPAAGGAPPSDDAMRMGSPPALPDGMTEEEIWPAATAEGWRKPCLVRWQRSFDDALRVAHARQQPILVAVNMDGEIASEHFAGVRYREPATAVLLEPYVCVIASVYRHTPRDYDEEGRRVPCPRFGTVTCGEHIEAERELYGKYFDGTRVSPRHIVLDVDGTETFDVYYSWDTETVFTTFTKGAEGWPEPGEPAEPTLVNLVQSADVRDRETLEREYEQGDRATKLEILTTLREARVVDQVELLRAGVFGLDVELARTARRALAQSETEGALDLMAEALKTPLETSERELLLDAVARLGDTSARARTLAALHSGLSSESRHIDAEALVREYEANAAHTVDVLTRERVATERPGEPGALLELAAALLERAQEATDSRFANLLFEDARAAARDAERAGAAGPELDAVLALAAAALGDYATAQTRAVAAVEGGLLQDDAPGSAALSEASRVRLLLLFARARQRAIREAYRAEGEWPPEWLSDVNAAYASVADNPRVDAATLVGYHDFLRWIGATPRANAVLDDALRRFPDSPLLHERLRGRFLWEAGPRGLEQGYAERLALVTDPGATQLTWFAAYASLVAAEHHRRRGEFEQAVVSYARAADYFETNQELFPQGRDNCRHFLALGSAGRARVALEQGDLGLATAALRAAFELRPDSAATADGLNITPVATAKMLLARLGEAGDAQHARELQAALDALDPALLEPPPSELPGPRAGRARGRRN